MLDFHNQIKIVVSQHPRPLVHHKADKTPVTPLDLALSGLIEKIGLEHWPDFSLYSEEKISDWKFPLLAIDPLDGTKEYILNRPEWAITIGAFLSESWEGEGWVYNPVTDEVFDENLPPRCFREKQFYRGEVSHTEWEKGLFQKYKSEKFHLQPKGSIAYKLGRLAKGDIDFVISLTPKNIWDIAGGSLLCERSGIHFYSRGKRVTKVEKMYHPPLIWSFEEISSELLQTFCSQDKDL